MAVQRALAEAGFYDGEIDGAIGPRTRASIAAWQNSIGAEASGILSPGQVALLADAAQAGSGGIQIGGLESAGAPDPAGVLVLAPDGLAAGAAERRIFRRELIRRAVAVAPGILDDDFLQTFLNDSGDFAEWNSAEFAGWREAVRSGTEFERRRAMESIRDLVLSQATVDPLSFVETQNAQLGAYDFDLSAFPLSVSDELGLGPDSYFAAMPGIGFGADLDAWAGVTSVAVSTGEAEGIAQVVEKNGRYVILAAETTLSNFRFTEAGLEADAVVSRVSAYSRGPNALLGSFLFEVPSRAAVPQAGGLVSAPVVGDALESWARLGADVEDGRVVVGMNQEYVKQNLQPSFDFLGLSLLPPNGPNLGNATALSMLYFEQADLEILFGSRTLDLAFFNDLGVDQFRQADIAKRFEATYEPVLRSYAPLLPVPVRAYLRLHPLEYDFDKQVFRTDIGPETPPDPKSDQRFTYDIDWTSIVTDIQGLDGNLKMSTEAAREFAALALAANAEHYGGRGELLVGLDMVLTAGTASEEYDRGININSGTNQASIRLRLSATVERAVVLRGGVGSEPLMELALFRPAAKVPVDLGTRMPPEASLTELDLAAFAQAQGVDQTAVDGLIKRTGDYTGSDEFARADVLNDVSERIRATFAPKDPIYLPIQMTLGEYDGEAFAVEALQVGWNGVPGEEVLLLPRDAFGINLENQAVLKRLPVPPVQARAMVADPSTGRVFSGVLRVALTGAQVVRGIGANPDYVGIDARALELFLSDRTDKGRQLLRLSFEGAVAGGEPPALSDPAEITAPLQPESAVLTPEVVTLLQVAHAGRVLDDALVLDLLRERYRLETEQTEREQNGYSETIKVARSPWGRFFPEGYRALTEMDEKNLLPAFRRWTELRLAAMPTRLVYEEINPQCYGGSAGQYGGQVQDPGAFGGVTLGGLPINRGYVMHLFDAAASGVAAPAQALSFSGLGRTADDLLVGLPDLTPPNDHVCAVSVAFDVVSVATHAVPSLNLPTLLVEVASTRVDWLSDRSRSTARKIVASYEVAPPVAAASAPGAVDAVGSAWDVVGLRLGMSLAEAEAAVRAHMPVLKIVELSNEDTATAIGQRARLYISEDATDFIIVNYGPASAEPRTFGISRNLFLALDSVADDKLIERLVKKYGARREDAVYNTPTWIWNKPAFALECAYGGVTPNISFIGTVLEGAPFASGVIDPATLASDPVLAKEVLVVARASNLFYDLDLPGIALPECGEIVRADMRRNWPATVPGLDLPGTEADLFSTRLVSPTAYQRALEAADAARRTSTPELEVKL